MKNSCTKMHVLRKNLVILQAIWRIVCYGIISMVKRFVHDNRLCGTHSVAVCHRDCRGRLLREN